MTEKRKVIDCRVVGVKGKCTLAISGTEEEVLKAGLDHAKSCHGEKDTPELRNEIKRLMKDAKD